MHIIANQDSYHDDELTWQCFTCLFCPRLVRNVRSRRHFDSSSIIAHPVNFDNTQWPDRDRYNAMPRTRHLYIYIHIYIYIQITLSVIDMDFLYQFNMRLNHFSFFFNVKQMCFKSSQVCDWLAKWLIMLSFMDLRWPGVVRRSNVGLVTYLLLSVYESSPSLSSSPSSSS